MTHPAEIPLEISTIIERAGGASAISAASNGELTTSAVYKWQKIGIPQKHWPLIIERTGATPAQLYEASRAVRGGAEAAA